MALARVQYEQTLAGTRSFSVTFPYISKDDITVSVDGVEATFEWLSPTLIQLDIAPSLGAIIDIVRSTERENVLVDFQDASTISEYELDLATRQNFFLAQESLDQAGSSLVVGEDGSYSASSRRITTLADPLNAQDAATKAWVESTFRSEIDQATVAADKAEQYLETFQENYWGASAGDPLVSPNGDDAEAGNLYYDTLTEKMKVFNGLSWVNAFAATAAPVRQDYVATEGQTTFSVPYTAPYVKVWVNGLLLPQSDYTATDGSTVVLSSGVPADTEVTVEGSVF